MYLFLADFADDYADFRGFSVHQRQFSAVSARNFHTFNLSVYNDPLRFDFLNLLSNSFQSP